VGITAEAKAPYNDHDLRELTDDDARLEVQGEGATRAAELRLLQLFIIPIDPPQPRLRGLGIQEVG
jgi:hypothetical protein